MRSPRAMCREEAAIPFGLPGLERWRISKGKIRRIEPITQQGEGGNKIPFSAPNVLSHFYAFGELYFLRKYQFNEKTQTGDWTGDRIPLPADQIFPMTPVPKGGYANPPSEVTDFDSCFTQMLKYLESAWSGGGDAALKQAIRIMPNLTTMATGLLNKQIRRPNDPGIYGPQFQINMSAPSTACTA